jgi:hypothetical protein
MFRDKISVPSSRIKQPKKMAPISCPETSVTNYKTTRKAKISFTQLRKSEIWHEVLHMHYINMDLLQATLKSCHSSNRWVIALKICTRYTKIIWIYNFRLKHFSTRWIFSETDFEHCDICGLISIVKPFLCNNNEHKANEYAQKTTHV